MKSVASYIIMFITDQFDQVISPNERFDLQNNENTKWQKNGKSKGSKRTFEKVEPSTI